MKASRVIFCVLMVISAPPLYAQVSNNVEGTYAVSVKDSLVSVKLEDASFGVVLEEIARHVGFGVDLSSDIYEKKLSTTFDSIAIERAIIRMFTLIREKNYTIYYHSTGLIKEVKAYGVAGEKKTVKPAPPRTAPMRETVKPVPYQAPPPVQPQAPPEPLTESEIQEMMDEPYPYIPPKEPPQYIPDRKVK